MLEVVKSKGGQEVRGWDAGTRDKKDTDVVDGKIPGLGRVTGMSV